MGHAVLLILLALWFGHHHRIALVATIAMAWHLNRIRRRFR